MDSEQRALLGRIEGFVLDDPAAALPFSHRLARDHGWTLDFAHRAIREYRRFIFLACCAGHPVTPSDEVDQVWHEHLTYTRSYWDEFCGGVLGRPLHHEPTQGGSGEEKKFREWYARTLASYERFFGEPPPRDLWPAVEQRFAVPRWRAGRELLRRWFRLRMVLRATALLSLCLALAGCVELFGANPLNLRGGDFLFLFWSLAVVAGVVGLGIRWWARQMAFTSPAHADALDAYSVALLSGRDVATNAALAQLVQTGALRIEPVKHQLLANRPPNAVSHELEKLLHQRISARGGMTPKDAAATALPMLQQMEHTLHLHGLLLTDEAARRVSWWAATPCIALLLFGGAKVLVGLSRDKPVDNLLFGCVVVLVASFAFVKTRPRRTRSGDDLMKNLRAEHRELRGNPLHGGPAYGGAALPLAIGLFGYAVLAHSQASGLRTIIPPPNEGSSGGCGSGCSGGDGGGGGSGCGGCGGD
jgi:uncharacterized protein (TIGR04222 family)